MNRDDLNRLLARLKELILSGSFDELEHDALEIKPVPSDGASWKQIYRSTCAFLNTHGGTLLLGVKEEQRDGRRKYVLTGWRPDAEEKLKEMQRLFADLADGDGKVGNLLDLSEYILSPRVIPFMDGQVAVIDVAELPADKKYVSYKGDYRLRYLTGDEQIAPEKLQSQRRYRDEARLSSELLPIAGKTIDLIDLDKLNSFIHEINRREKVEKLKASLDEARPFLERKKFAKGEQLTWLGALVCIEHPGDHLGFRAQLQATVEADSTSTRRMARDTRQFIDNVIPLMEQGYEYLASKVETGVSLDRGGSPAPEYPMDLLRETVNNALAHRDYRIEQQVFITVRPGVHVAIRNPGRFRKTSLVEIGVAAEPVRRLIPDSNPINPKLADVLRIYRKWEGRGIGMATLVNRCLADEIDVPYYTLRSDEVELTVPRGPLVTSAVRDWLDVFGGYIDQRTSGERLTEAEVRLLAYLAKSQRLNLSNRYTVLLTSDNNHASALQRLLQSGLLTAHPDSSAGYPVYLVDRLLLRESFARELNDRYGQAFVALSSEPQRVLSECYLAVNYSRGRVATAKGVAKRLWARDVGGEDIHGFDNFYRKVRSIFENLRKRGFLEATSDGAVTDSGEAGKKKGPYVLGPGPSQGVLV